ncbi:Dyp-type peroxidase [Demequina litorisediminis]|uniref:Peroxidase n=1 Tax=Demequina litorisediminis TaxID=1849022 RepID=A0ABQ6ICU1_9MICO|nr:Dyp-type peroxidase [Demequina litorisediminis]GMA35524.1 peroxidase [Demequina litorisediminis]
MSRDATEPGRGLSRRGFLFGGAAAGAGAAVALGVDRALASEPRATLDATGLNGARTVDFHGAHQAGIATPIASHATYVALDLHGDTDRDALRRMMRVLSDDAARLMAGTGALADTEPELATVPAALTVTFGFGPEAVRRGGGDAAAPAWLGPLPAFDIDALEDRWSGGDVLLLVSADDAVTVAHAVRMLLKDSRSFASVRWRQDGFRRAYGSEVSGTTMRNLFGQVDGTTNPEPGTSAFDDVVWTSDPGWLAGGTSLVLRRIRLDLDVWDEVDPVARSFAVGRRISDGAPLTGTREADEPNFEATTAAGNTVISPVAHIARSRPVDPREVIFRRGYNYDVPPTGDAVSESGLLFASFQADVDAQFTPIQRRLAEGDLLNTWTTPIGSAVFAIPPGCQAGGYVGQTLLD